MRIYRTPQKDYKNLLKSILLNLDKKVFIKLFFILITAGFGVFIFFPN